MTRGLCFKKRDEYVGVSKEKDYFNSWIRSVHERCLRRVRLLLRLCEYE